MDSRLAKMQREAQTLLDDETLEHVGVLFEAVALYEEREKKYKGLWKEGGVADSLRHITSKSARVHAIGEGRTDLDDALDLINYTVFLIRNFRAGRLNTTQYQLIVATEDIKEGELVVFDFELGTVTPKREEEIL